ncbi:MAG: hypothetical protein JW876_10825 [Candidatus Krumholzibacteriota bacterium]|nr:hypothetical protein [Candidatus Krumholzibacteriota bacterium]
MSVRYRLPYWMPVLLPVLIGLLLPLLQLVAGISESDTIRNAELESGIQFREYVDATLKRIPQKDQNSDPYSPALRERDGLIDELNNNVVERLELKEGTKLLLIDENGRVEIDEDLLLSINQLISQVANSRYMRNIRTDVKKWVATASESICLSIISIDIWAFSILFTLGAGRNAGQLYAYPLVGIFLHIVLLIICNVVSNPQSTLRLSFAAVVGFIAIIVAIWVRDIIWKFCDGREEKELPGTA